MRVAVITPYYRETPDVLRQCLESVQVQTSACTHFVVADGYPQNWLGGFPVEHITLPKAHGDNGNTARSIGSLSAMNQGFDAIAYLDADNWFYPEHIEAMIFLHQESGAIVGTSTRSVHRLDGSLMYVDESESDGSVYADTSCLFLTRPAFKLLPAWAMMPKEMGPLCDRIFWELIQGNGYTCAHYPLPTVAFRTQYQVHYEAIGEVPPGGAKGREATYQAYEWWQSLPADERHRWLIHLGLPDAGCHP